MAEEYRIDLKLQPDTQGVSAATADINKFEDQVERAQKSTNRWSAASVGASAGIQNMGNQAEVAGKKAAGMGKVMKTILAYMAVFASYATVKSVVRGFGEWELGLVGISKTTELAKNEIVELGHEFLKFARQNPTDANTLTAIAQAAGQVGVQGKENLRIFSETVAKLVESSNLHAEESVFFLKKVLDLTGETTAESKELASVWVALGNTMAATESQIARSSMEVAKGTAAFGLPSADASAIAGALIVSGTQPELSRSTMLRIFSSMNKAVQGNERLMTNWTELMKMSSQEFQDAWSRDKGQLFTDFIGKVVEQGGKAQAALEKLQISGLRAVPAVLGLAKVYATGLVPAMEMARKESQSAGAALNTEYDKFRNAFLNIQKTVGHVVGEISDLLGEELAPTLVKMTRAMTDSMSGWLDSGRALKTFHGIAKGFTVVMNHMADAMRILAAYVLISLIKMFGRWAAGLVVVNQRLVVMSSLLKGIRLALGFAVLYLGAEFLRSFSNASSAVSDLNDQIRQLSVLNSVGPSMSGLQPDININAAEVMAAEMKEGMARAVAVVSSAFVGISALLGSFFRYAAMNLADLIRVVFDKLGISLQIKLEQILLQMQSTLNNLPLIGFQFDLEDNREKIAQLQKDLDAVTASPVTFQAAYEDVRSSGRPQQLKEAIEGLMNRPIGAGLEVGAGVYHGQSVSGLTMDQVRQSQAQMAAIQNAIDRSNYWHPGMLDQKRSESGEWWKNPIQEQAIDPMVTRWNDAMKEMKSATHSLFVDSVPAAIGDSVVAIMEGAARIQDVFRDLARMILSTMIQLIVELTARMLIIQALTGTAFGNWLGLPSAPPAGSLPPSGATGLGAPVAPGVSGGATGGLFTPIQGYMRGGPVFGPGTGTSDEVNARLSAGEFVVNKRNTDRFAPLLHAINSYSGSGSRGLESSSGPSRVVIEDHRPPESPRLDVEVMPGLNPRQVNELRVLVREESAQARKTGRDDAQLRGTYGVHRRPVRRG